MRKMLFAWASTSFIGALVFCLSPVAAWSAVESADSLVGAPSVGTASVRLLTPTLLELHLVTTKLPPPARVKEWDFITGDYQFNPPDPALFQITINGQPATVETVGFRRRPLYAPLRKRDLRIGNSLFLQLTTPVEDGQTVQVATPASKLWPTNAPSAVVADPLRLSPAIHVNQTGYLLNHSKKAMIGYYLGSFGELRVPLESGFELIDSQTGGRVFSGQLTRRLDAGYTYSPAPYQQVLEADFSAFNTPGQYRLLVPGLGASLPFRIGHGVAALFARTYALGMYHQRCGAGNELPFTRHTHGACHLAKADVPTMTFSAVNKALAEFSSDFARNPRHTARQLKDINSSLYPFVNLGKIDVAGGHHDAGDYSKYTINVAQLVHALVFAVDALPGVAELDNLGLPESGDGISDILQEAKWEADLLAKLQDSDGGFYFLVYPRNRPYEDNVLPDRGDTQVVFPKTTAATAAGVAALAQAASSPLFRKHYPESAAAYFAHALKGWQFLQQAFAQFGRDGSYQKISHYGDEFMHDDEIAWAAAELYAATGDPAYQNELITRFDPADRNTRKFTWWRMFEGYGCAVRSYAFAARTGRLSREQLSPEYLAKCEAEIVTAGRDQVRFARENAYGSSFPDPNKAFRSAGWYFSVDQTFDIAVAAQLEASPDKFEALLSNMAYEAGCNPLNLAFLTGIGSKRQVEIVHQYALNDRRVLPQSGIPLGNLQTGFTEPLSLYPSPELAGLCFPADKGDHAAYAPYDVWADTYNTTTEAVTVQQGRSLASMGWLMAQTPLATQPWKSAVGVISTEYPNTLVGMTNRATLAVEGLDLTDAEIVWEGRNQQPSLGATFRASPPFLGPQWIEAEAVLPDGRRIFAVGSFEAVPSHPITALGSSQFKVAGVAGQDFVVERSTDLKHWVPILTNTFFEDTFEFTDDPDDNSARFYRAISAPRE